VEVEYMAFFVYALPVFIGVDTFKRNRGSWGRSHDTTPLVVFGQRPLSSGGAYA
jgi:hypothetical protein